MTRYWSATVRWYRWSSSLDRRTGQCEEAHEHLTTATTMHRELDMRFWLTRSPRLPLRLAPPRPPTRRRRLRHGFFHTIISLPLIVSVVPRLSHRRMICSTASLSWPGSQT